MNTTQIQIIGLGSDEWSADEWERYGTVRVSIDGVTYEVGSVIGVPQGLRQTAVAAGGDQITPYLSAWYADSSDWSQAPASDGSEGVPGHLSGDVLAAIEDAAVRLWGGVADREVAS